MIKKFIMLAGFSIAVTSFVFQYIKNAYILIGVFIVVYTILWLLLEIEKCIRNSKGTFFDKYFYIFGRANNNYTIEYIDTCYEYISKNEMKYSKDLELKSCSKDLKIFKDKFCWSAYGNSFTIAPKFSDHKVNILAPKNLWTIFEINFGQRYKKKEYVKTGYDVLNLKDELGVAKPFLSHRSDAKIKERSMTVVVPKELKPINAKFEIYKTSETGKIIRSESLAYDESIKGFTKKIFYPRRGWTYAIVWDWADE